MNTAGSQRRETSRQRRQRETRQALLEAAYRSFCELGYADCSLERIASRAGFTKGALYGHFSSKEDLFLALVEARTGSVMDAWAQAVPENASREVLLHSLGQWLATTVREQQEWCLVNAEFSVLAARKPSLAARRREVLDQVCADIRAVLDRLAGPEREPGGSVAASHLVLALINGLALHAALDPEIDVAKDFALGLGLLAAPSTRIDKANTVRDTRS
jgi:AcrR family transcriptional regulator